MYKGEMGRYHGTNDGREPAVDARVTLRKFASNDTYWEKRGLGDVNETFHIRTHRYHQDHPHRTTSLLDGKPKIHGVGLMERDNPLVVKLPP